MAENVGIVEAGEVAALLRDITMVWKEATTEEKGRLIAPLIERAYIELETKRIGAITPAPAFRSLLDVAMQRTAGQPAVLLAPQYTPAQGILELVETGES